MKMRSQPHFLLLLVAIFVLSACGSTATAPVAQSAAVETKQQAMTTALAYLNQQPYAEQYLADTAVVEDAGEAWQVTVKRINWKKKRPGVGVLVVSKATGEASWLPLR